MKKLTYAIALSSLLLAGCSQNEGIMESKGELVTMNYNVSLSDGVQSRTGETPELEVNKLLCAVFENGNQLYREIVDVNENGTATFSPKLFDKTDYRIVFWAYYENEDEDSCYELEDLEEITVNDNYDCDEFTDNAKKDAFTYVDEVNLSQNKITKNVELTRPFGKVTVMTSVADYQQSIQLNGTPTSSELTITGHNDVFNALTGKWSQSKDNTSITLKSEVQDLVGTLDDDNTETQFIYLANEYLFSGGDSKTKTNNCEVTIVVKGYKENENGDTQKINLYERTISNVPVGANASTNMYNENLLTGGGVTYNISINTGFTEGTNNVTE